MPVVGRPGQPGYKEFPYTKKGVSQAEAYAKEKDLPITHEGAAAAGPSKGVKPQVIHSRTSVGRMNISTPSTRRY